MNSESEQSLVLVRRAREGDMAAWETICRKYYPRWLARYHGQLGDTLRRLSDTEDLIQSAMAEAIKGIHNLREEAAFYAWVTAIIRRKIADRRQVADRLKPVSMPNQDALPHGNGTPQKQLTTQEEQVRLLDAIIQLFPVYTTHMSILYLKYYSGVDLKELADLFQKSERSIQRLLRSGLVLLKSSLAS